MIKINWDNVRKYLEKIRSGEIVEKKMNLQDYPEEYKNAMKSKPIEELLSFPPKFYINRIVNSEILSDNKKIKIINN